MSLRENFAGLLPARPYCADEPSHGLVIRQRDAALRRRHVQFNTPAALRWLLHDIDHAEAYFAHEDANLPQPNVIVVNRQNRHAHAAYLLKFPVARHDMARIGPLRFFAAVERGIGRRLGADRSYTGLIAKNPTHTYWQVEWRRDEPYALSELEGWLFERDMRPDPSAKFSFGAGRNVTVFEELRVVAYREVRLFKQDSKSFEPWFNRCIKIAAAINCQFAYPLKTSEIRAIAKSVATWTWKHFTAHRFSAIQTHRAQTRTRNHLEIVAEIKLNACARPNTEAPLRRGSR